MGVTPPDPDTCRRLAEWARATGRNEGAGDLLEVAAQLESSAEMAEEVEAVKHILGAGFSSETLRQAAARVEVNCAERARERDAARAEADQLRARVAELERLCPAVPAYLLPELDQPEFAARTESGQVSGADGSGEAA